MDWAPVFFYVFSFVRWLCTIYSTIFIFGPIWALIFLYFWDIFLATESYLNGSFMKKSPLTMAIAILGTWVTDDEHQMLYIWWFIRLQAVSMLSGNVIEQKIRICSRTGYITTICKQSWFRLEMELNKNWKSAREEAHEESPMIQSYICRKSLKIRPMQNLGVVQFTRLFSSSGFFPSIFI